MRTTKLYVWLALVAWVLSLLTAFLLIAAFVTAITSPQYVGGESLTWKQVICGAFAVIWLPLLPAATILELRRAMVKGWLFPLAALLMGTSLAIVTTLGGFFFTGLPALLAFATVVLWVRWRPRAT